MTRRRGLLLAVLLYVTLDLSLPAMPGAFVFEPADSVETIHGPRGRGAAEVVPLPTPQIEPNVAAQPHLDRKVRAPAVIEIEPGVDRLVCRLPRAILDSAPPSEDSH
jgi:hypothetical protein